MQGTLLPQSCFNWESETMLSSTTIRLEKRVLERINKLANRKYLDRGTYMRQLIMKQLQEECLEESLKEYTNKKITIEELAEKNNTSILELLDVFKIKNISLNVSLEDVEGSADL